MKTSQVSFFICAAVAATALVGSAAASAAQLKDGGEAVASGTTIEAAGAVGFSRLGTGIGCEATATLEATSSTEAELISVESEAATCEGFGVLFNACTVEGGETAGLPWMASITSGKNIRLTDGTLEVWLNAGCKYGDAVFLSFEKGEATPDNYGAIGAVSIFGGGEAILGEFEFPVEAYGELEITNSPGTYQIS